MKKGKMKGYHPLSSTQSFFSLCVPRSNVLTKIGDDRVVTGDYLIGPVSSARVTGAFCSRRRQSDNFKCN